MSIIDLNKEIAKIVICPYCKGVGETERRTFKGHTEGVCISSEQCNLCNGNGMLLKRVTVVYKTLNYGKS